MPETAENKRLSEGRDQLIVPWLKWGPYVSERSWGTVREDYSADGNAWSSFPYDLAASTAYRWGEDGIAGWCDRYQVLSLLPAFWNEQDGSLKERLFGLSIFDGNHGEDVKECYYHLDGVPSHAYMKYLYKYPQKAFPYEELRIENVKRSTHDPEYELIDTGIFDEGRYFDIFIEYAKDCEEGVCIKIEAFNRGPDPAPLHFLMQMAFRNQWSWGREEGGKPRITRGEDGALIADEADMPSPPHLALEYTIGKRYLYGSDGAEVLFTNNETRHAEDGGHYKDAFHRKIVKGEEAVSPDGVGTKAALHYRVPSVEPGGSAVVYFRLSDRPLENPLQGIEELIATRKKETDAFYEATHPEGLSEDEKKIQRQALAGLVWSKQIYFYDVNQWLKGDNPDKPPPEGRSKGRNNHWRHLNSMRILIMPDKWEYPWFAAWDHVFHCITYSIIDMEFAKKQLWLLLFDQFQHPNGQIPACEWDFSDLNPPVHAWAVLRLYHMEKERTGKEDIDFLEKCFHKLILNFTWWVNKVDNVGNNVFEGGFLGLDNITVLDRSEKLPGGAILQQSDGTGWMAMFSLNLMRMALELSKHNKVYEGLATKFFQHYVYIAHAMKKRGNRDYEMWSDTDGFFYDVLTYPDGTFTKFRVRSLVGLIPLFAVEILHEEFMEKHPEFYRNFQWFMNNRKDLVDSCIIPTIKDGKKHYVCTPMNAEQLESVLKYVWDPEEFRANFGLRSMSRFHEKNPFVFQDKQVGYEPAESLYTVKGGNSNWRGPIWMPTTFLLVDSLLKLTEAFEEDITIKSPNEEPISIGTMAESFANRIIDIFAYDEKGQRPVFGPNFPFSDDPYWKDHILFHEYYNPETGKGLGASHQTGWSAIVANFIDDFRGKS
ncbi:MAG: hypothetical protein KR126chlam1_00511 [Chlamydiae bacterium]|nr:hypothetical protein [Chlamydiota bacterium]